MSGVWKGISALLTGNAVAMALPLVSLPYLTRVLGLEGFATYAVVGTIIGIGYLACDYSDEQQGTRALAGRSLEQRWEYLASVLRARLVLALVGAVLVMASLMVIPYGAAPFMSVVGASLVCVLGKAIFVPWALVATGQSATAGLILCLSRAAALALQLLIVVAPEDVTWAIAANGVGWWLGGAYGLTVLFRSMPRTPESLTGSWTLSRAHMVRGWPLFQASLLGNVYGQGSMLVVNGLCSSTVTGVYAIWERVYRAAGGGMAPLSTALIALLGSGTKPQRHERRWLVVAGCAAVALSGVGWLTAASLFHLLTGQPAGDGLVIGQAFCLVLPLTVLLVLLHPMVVVRQLDGALTIPYRWIAIFFFPIASLLVFWWSALGMVMALGLVELSLVLWYLRAVFTTPRRTAAFPSGTSPP